MLTTANMFVYFVINLKTKKKLVFLGLLLHLFVGMSVQQQGISIDLFSKKEKYISSVTNTGIVLAK